jgi:hypothetical protein
VAADPEWAGNFLGGVLEHITYGGKVYAVPTSLSAQVCFYNEEIYDKYGLTIPQTQQQWPTGSRSFATRATASSRWRSATARPGRTAPTARRSRMGVAFIRGIQVDEGCKYRKAGANVKHYVVHSGPERLRHEIDVKIGPKEFRETYLYAFAQCIREAHVACVMARTTGSTANPARAARL